MRFFNLTPFISIYQPTPFVPLPWKGRGRAIKKRGEAPLERPS